MPFKRAVQIILVIIVFLPVGLARANTPDPSSLDYTFPMTDPKLISSDVLDGYEPAVAYNENHDEYLVVWHYFNDIYAQRISSRGELLGNEMTITNHSNKEDSPALAYDPNWDRYLVVWQRDSGSGHKDIYGRFIPWNGPISGWGAFPIDSTTNDTRYPKIAYGFTQAEYMVVWTRFTGGWPEYEIDGVRVEGDGSGIPAIPHPHVASHINDNRQNPDITYNLAKNEYLVVYDNRYLFDYSGTHDDHIYGVIMAGNGTKLYGGEFGIAAWPGDEYKPAVAACNFGTQNIGQYLVSWVSYFKINDTTYEPRVYARYLDGNGNAGGVYMIDNVTPSYPSAEIDIACRWGRQYLMVWEHWYASEIKTGLWGRLLYSDESMESNFEIQKPESGDARENMAVANGSRAFLVAWEHRDSSGYADIYGRIIGETPPKADFTISPSSGPTNTIFQFDASNSSDFETAKAYLEVRWDWGGEGNYDTNWSKTKTASHQFHSDGNKLVRLQVKDGYGLLATAEKTVQVTNTPPTADFTITPGIGDNTTVFQFDASPSHDLEDPASALQVCWDWDNDGTCDTAWATQKTAGHVFMGATYGSYTVRLRVMDTKGMIGATTKSLMIDNKPTASFTVTPPNGDTNTTFDFNPEGSSDPDVGKYWIYWRWDWENNGSYDTPWTSDVYKHTYHHFSQPGNYTVRLEVRQFDGSLTDTTTRQVNVIQGTYWPIYLPYIAQYIP
jgi:hypothetical protein